MLKEGNANGYGMECQAQAQKMQVPKISFVRYVLTKFNVPPQVYQMASQIYQQDQDVQETLQKTH